MSGVDLERRITSCLAGRPDLDSDEIAVGVMRSYPDKRSLEEAVEHLVLEVVLGIRFPEPVDHPPVGFVPPPVKRDWLSTLEVADLCGVSTMTVYRWVEHGYVAAARLGAKGLYRFRRSDIEALVIPDAPTIAHPGPAGGVSDIAAATAADSRSTP